MTFTSPKSFVDPMTQVVELHSTINERDYEIRIRLPLSYGSGEARYPVFVVLDAEFSFGIAWETAMLEALWCHRPGGTAERTMVPETIVVSIAFPDSLTNRVRRNFEYMPAPREADILPAPLAAYIAQVEKMLGRTYQPGGAADFLEILRQEVLPFIDATYRTDTVRRMLFGQSASGCFACFALLTKPATFTDYIIASPGLGDNEIFRLEADWAAAHDDLPARVLLTAGGREVTDPLCILSRTAQLAETLHARNYPTLDLRTWFMPDASHIQTGMPSIARGLVELLGSPAKP